MPLAALVQGANGDFYGSTTAGGADGIGTLFKITSSGDLTALYSFSGRLSGSFIGLSPLIQATDGNFYGAGATDGTDLFGMLFRITPEEDTLTTLYNFTGGTDGLYPNGMSQATNGTLYGTTQGGRPCDSCNPDNSTVFSLGMGLGPFVSFVRSLGHVGVSVQILGQGFTGATAVSFNGISASFAVKSDTYLTATVPVGATNGFVTVTEPSGTLTSNKIFRVVPWISNFSPASGPAGTTVVINGESFTGATRVVFACGNQATFTVDSDTQITATVPARALTGAINVVTPSGPVGSTTDFTVTP
ncbi:MAG: choice-of-anchor tandem repeat GloVer-containing protein [Candidatus Sulfotelmatobacter sp.]